MSSQPNNNTYNQNLNPPNPPYMGNPPNQQPFNQINQGNQSHQIPPSGNQPQSAPKSFLEKVNSTASGLFKFIKSKAPPIANTIIPKKLLDNTDPVTKVSEIYLENFEKNIISKSTKELVGAKLENSNINNIPIVVKLTNPQIINNSIFSSNYVIYNVYTEKMNWNVTRRYSDFIWLRDCLQSLFPADLIPILPKKKIGNRRFENDFINKRQMGLQKFIDEIVSVEKFKATEILKTFLSCVSEVINAFASLVLLILSISIAVLLIRSPYIFLP